MRTIFSAVLLSVLMSQPISGLVAPLRSRGNIVLTNDDGWATAQLRSEYSALKAAGFNVVLSAPATDQSGTGSSSAAPTQLNTTCEFDTCPKGSPFTGHEPFDLNINYYNAFPADSVRFGIQTLSPRLLGSKPMLVVSGTNIGTNLGDVVMISGTVGAATEAALEGIPSIAFSGDSGDFVSYTKLVTDPHSSAVIAANIYTELVIKFVDALLSGPGSEILPSDVSLNVNFPSIKKCPSANSFSFALTRILKNTGNSNDVEICGNKVLPNEDSVFGKDCFITVSPFHVPTKTDVDASTQEFVLQKLGSILSCPH